MAGINVLLDPLKGGNKLEKTSTQKGKDSIDSPDNAAEIFAAILSGSMNLNANPKGQNSSLAGEDKKGTQSVGNSEQTPQKQSTLLFLTQLMLQSDFPAGKEANSGSVVSQGTGSEVPLVSEQSLATTGMGSLNSQGNSPEIAELDKYKEVIAGLLEALSGEITNTSLKRTSLSSESTGTKDLSQDMAKIVQGWMTVSDEVAKYSNSYTLNGNLTSGQAQEKGEEGTKALLGGNETRANLSSTQIINGLEALIREIRESTAASPRVDPLSSKSSGPRDTRQDVTKGVQGDKALELLAGLSKEITALASQKDTLSSGSAGIKAFSQDILKAAQDRKSLTSETVGNREVLSDSKGTKSLLGPVKQLKGTDIDQVANQEHTSQSSEQSQAMNDTQNQKASTAIGVASNTVVVNVASGKTVASPVWEQITTGFREQVLNRHQELKELDIQLHPADLGKIQIAMRWENGLVHLVVHASEAATGTILQNQLSDLRHTLADQGVNCGTLQMGQGGDQRQNHRGDEPQRMFNQSSNSNTDEELTPGINPVFGGQDEINRINVTA